MISFPSALIYASDRLVGGGEAGPPISYKLELLDSAHVEVMRIGTYRKDWGGLDRDELVAVMTSGSILIPQIEALPTAVRAGPDKAPELEIRFDMEEISPEGKQLANLEQGDFEAFCKEPLPLNWQLRFLHNQFFKTFVFPSRFCPGPFHSTILRKAGFRSAEHRAAYFKKCAIAIANWRREGPKALNTIPRHLDTQPFSKEERKASQVAQDKEDDLEKFGAIARRDSNDTSFAEPTEEEEEAVAELVDKLAAMAPLPPAATTAKATANLEVSLDEGYSSGEEEAAEPENEAKDKKETNDPQPVVQQPSGESGDMTEGGEEAAEGEPSEEANAETTNKASPEESSDDVQVVAETTIEQQVPTFPDTAGETVAESTTEITEGVSEAPSDEACAENLSIGGTYNPPIRSARSTAPEDCHSGIWLFTDRANITHFFAPNFLPPYDTPEKRKIIFDVLREEWDEKSLSWKTCGHGSMTKKKEKDQEGNVLGMVSGVVSAVMDGVC